MALTNTGGTVHIDGYSGVIARYLKEAKLISEGHVFVQGGFNDTFKIPRISLSDAIQENKETPDTSKGAVTVDNATLSLSKYDVFFTFNPQSLKTYWKPWQADGEFNFKTLPAHAQASMTSVLLNQVAGKNDVLFVRGSKAIAASADTENIRYVDGFITKASADGQVYDLSGATTITQSNVISELQRAVRQARRNSSTVRLAMSDTENFKLFVSQYTKDLYGDASRALAQKGANIHEGTPDRINGYKLVALPGMPDNAIFGAVGQNSPSSNLWVGVNDTGDLSSVKIERFRPESELFFVKMTIALATCIVKPEEVFLYKA